MKRVLPFLLALVVILASATPVSAAEDSGWIELLEISSVQTNGENWFTIGQSGSVTIPLQSEKRLRKIDMLLWNPTNQRPTAASVTVGSYTTNLEVLQLGSNMCRIFGYLPSAFYEAVTVELTKADATSQTYEVLSCKVTPLGTQEFTADASATIAGTAYTCPFSMSYNGSDVEDTYHFQFPIMVKDWQKYDAISINGSIGQVALNSVRVTVGTLGLPYEISYTTTNESGFYGNSYAWNEMKYYSSTDSYQGTTEDSSFMNTTYSGKVLFTITIDLSGVDRTSTQNLVCYFTGLVNDAFGYSVQVVSVTGLVKTADTSEVTWWNRFTSFMSDLFGKDDPEADDYQSEMESQAGAMQDAVDQMDQVTKPPVEDLDISLDEYMSGDGAASLNGFFDAVFGNDLIVTMLVVSLTCAFVSYVLYGKR